MKKRTVIYADEGMVLTDGNTYGTQIFLADGEDATAYHEITKEEYEANVNAEMETSETHHCGTEA